MSAAIWHSAFFLFAWIVWHPSIAVLTLVLTLGALGLGCEHARLSEEADAGH